LAQYSGERCIVSVKGGERGGKGGPRGGEKKSFPRESTTFCRREKREGLTGGTESFLLLPGFLHRKGTNIAIRRRGEISIPCLRKGVLGGKIGHSLHLQRRISPWGEGGEKANFRKWQGGTGNLSRPRKEAHAVKITEKP